MQAAISTAGRYRSQFFQFRFVGTSSFPPPERPAEIS